jgi:hypothetical protein
MKPARQPLSLPARASRPAPTPPRPPVSASLPRSKALQARTPSPAPTIPILPTLAPPQHYASVGRPPLEPARVRQRISLRLDPRTIQAIDAIVAASVGTPNPLNQGRVVDAAFQPGQGFAQGWNAALDAVLALFPTIAPQLKTLRK